MREIRYFEIMRWTAILVLLLFCGLKMSAQVALGPMQEIQIAQQHKESSLLNRPEMKQLFPQHVLDNPTGYSYLCRLELKIEDQLPVPVWLKLGASPGLVNQTQNNAYLRFKLMRF